MIEIHVGERFLLTKSAAKSVFGFCVRLEIRIQISQSTRHPYLAEFQVAQIVFARLCQRRESTNPHGQGFALECGNHVFTLWKVKRVHFKRSLAGNVVSVARIMSVKVMHAIAQLQPYYR